MFRSLFQYFILINGISNLVVGKPEQSMEPPAVSDYLAFVKSQHLSEDTTTAKDFNSLLDHIENNLENNLDSFLDAQAKYGKLVNVLNLEALEPSSINGSYAPEQLYLDHPESCHHTPGIQLDELEWTTKRAEIALENLKQYIKRTNLDVSLWENLDAMTVNDMPRISLLLSGGGLRAMLNTAGFIKAADIRSSPNSSLGGILQSSMYIMALSGGSWTLGSLVANEFNEIEKIKRDQWYLENNIAMYNPSNPEQYAITYYSDMLFNILAKSRSSFSVCINDLWGQIITSFTHPKNRWFRVSDIKDTDWFKSHSFPFPIITTILNTQENINELEADLPVIEITPYAFRSDHRKMPSSFSIQYIGSPVMFGELYKYDPAIVGYDILGYALGSSSMIFAFAEQVVGNQFFKSIVNWLMKFDDYAFASCFWPNPFKYFGFRSVSYNWDTLRTLDGGVNTMNSPYLSALQSTRNSDVIIVSENEVAELSTLNWPTGMSIRNAYEYTRKYASLNTVKSMPYVPDLAKMAELGLNKRVTFFGVEESADITTPVVIYMPNHARSYKEADKPTLQASYTNDERDKMIQNFKDIASNGDEQIGGEYSQCVACAVVERWRARQGFDRSETCSLCFKKYGF